MRSPISGQLYEAFKNANRHLPSELRLRRPKTNKEGTKMAAEKELSTNNSVKGSGEAFEYDKHRQGMENQGSIKTAVDHGLGGSCESIGRYLYYLLFQV